MRLRFAIAAVAVQVLALGYLAGEREWILQAGRTVWLRTAPIDPRDVMRGDYVRLEYEIGHVDRAVWQDGLTNWAEPVSGRSQGKRVYASLRVHPDGLAEVTALSDRQPKEGLFLRGKLGPDPRWGRSASVRYGLEAFFMEQGKAKELEDDRLEARRGVPLNMQAAVGGNGTGVLKGYRWESLGLVVDFDLLRRTNSPMGFPQQQNVIVDARVELKNHGTNPVAVVDLPGGRSFGLICDSRWSEPAYRWVGETNTVPPPEARDVIVLQPGQSHRSRLDLTRPDWFVVDLRTNAANRLPKPIQQLSPDWNTGFRIQYRPPPAEACASLPHAQLIWHGRLRSRWFNPMGNVD